MPSSVRQKEFGQLNPRKFLKILFVSYNVYDQEFE